MSDEPARTEVCTVVHVPERSRYEARSPDGGELMGVLEYRRTDGVVVMPRTVTLPPFRGRGVAAAMTRRALDDAAAAGDTVVPACWYVAQFVERNPDYARLVA
ncbi:GNAT family N-acetyltransferase [Puerhibacterium puerhi]|uniref:GNAT family N-acetyltransferase n=1 Tax=Puerhibacterium puerhi TaxID=2692623 RepID=UPI001359D62D|nr:GNAT family N-acetyltransferase [Puerhibacterium puerhi]